MVASESASVSAFRLDHEAFASDHHEGQFYAEFPYPYHLRKVEQVLADFGFDSMLWRARAWLHDVIEDCLKQFKPIQRRGIIWARFGPEVSGPVWNVSGFGKTRKLRNADILSKIAGDVDSCILKAADRIANMEQTILDDDSKASMYAKEYPEFIAVVGPHIPAGMKARLDVAYERLKARG